MPGKARFGQSRVQGLGDQGVRPEVARDDGLEGGLRGYPAQRSVDGRARTEQQRHDHARELVVVGCIGVRQH